MIDCAALYGNEKDIGDGFELLVILPILLYH